MSDDGKLIWIDLEMSGLVPETDRILEAAVLITDGELNLIAEGPELVIHQPEEVLAAMDEWNTKHHTASGLVDRVRRSTTSESEAENEILHFIQQHCEPRTAPLAGNSIHQDRLFIRRYWTALEAYLHYRNVDVSTVKELVSRWYPQTYAQRPSKVGAHRALSDIHESIKELQFYRKGAFR